ncbi:DIE2/ALG10 family [Musa troglodytarum]|uniref:Dol-P-Glc:Glc(2)Man(9)GlcNAc(2)-PP-Dol alpha-1,2-glucosyltransferase n=1 Tax=Musa troglodytarum TaxID=320322 RepID=A0A9E7KGF8_9LILI|nr:DIE2/ALG10 family [Musa troglodytarum]
MGRIAVAAVVSLWVIPISVLVDRVVPDPYMDEIFHIPQAQRYCRGDFGTWDPMITTPPGLYYLSLVYIASLFPSMWFAKFAPTMSSICSTATLRSTNAVVAVICSVLIYDLLIQLRPTLDVASLTAVLAMYLASLKRKYWLSAMLGALATTFRQTNIIWMFFTAANSAVSYAENLYGQDSVLQNKHKTMLEDNDLLSHNRSTPISSGLRKRRMHNSSSNSQQSAFERSEFSLHHPPGFFDEILDVISKLWILKWKVAIAFAPFVMVLLAFVTFVIWNGSIVLGAKEAHAVSPHFAQMLYFGLCCAAALGPSFNSWPAPARNGQLAQPSLSITMKSAVNACNISMLHIAPDFRTSSALPGYLCYRNDRTESHDCSISPSSMELKVRNHQTSKMSLENERTNINISLVFLRLQTHRLLPNFLGPQTRFMQGVANDTVPSGTSFPRSDSIDCLKGKEDSICMPQACIGSRSTHAQHRGPSARVSASWHTFQVTFSMPSPCKDRRARPISNRIDVNGHHFLCLAMATFVCGGHWR